MRCADSFVERSFVARYPKLWAILPNVTHIGKEFGCLYYTLVVLQYAITEGTARLPGRPNNPANPPCLPALIDQCARLACEGVAFLLVRERHLSAAALVALTRSIVSAVRSAAPSTSTRVLVSSRADIALAAGADGLHLSSAPGELTPSQVRVILPRAIVSVSCHTVDEVRRARDQQASLILFAPVFGKWVKGIEVTSATGLDALRAAAQAADPTPVLALGGVSAANAPRCLAAGAAGVAGIRMFFDPPKGS